MVEITLNLIHTIFTVQHWELLPFMFAFAIITVFVISYIPEKYKTIADKSRGYAGGLGFPMIYILKNFI